MKIFKYSLVGLIFVLGIKGSLSQDAKEIVRTANDLLRSTSSFSEIEMTIIKQDWTREYIMKIWALEPDFALALILKPAKEKGMVTLKRKREVWNWIPAVQRTIKIPPSMMLQSWMGSDFTNDDLVRQSSIVEDYEHKIIGEDIILNHICHKIQLNPKPEAGVVWGKIIMWISKEDFLQLRTDFYDEDAYLVKKMIGKDVRQMGGRIIPVHWEMIPLDKPEQKTIFKYTSIEFNAKLSERFFSIQNMKRIR
jgi:outer membrane lipoprotein-sorting protein